MRMKRVSEFLADFSWFLYLDFGKLILSFFLVRLAMIFGISIFGHSTLWTGHRKREGFNNS